MAQLGQPLLLAAQLGLEDRAALDVAAALLAGVGGRGRGAACSTVTGAPAIVRQPRACASAAESWSV